MGADRPRRARRPGEPAGAARRRTARTDAHLAHGQGQRCAVPAAADPAVLLLFRVRHDRRRLGLQTFMPTVLDAGLRRVAGARDVDAHRLSAGRRRGHRRRRLSRRAHDAPRPRRRRRDAARGAALLALVATGAVPRPLLLPLFVADRLRAGRRPARRATSSCAPRRPRARRDASTASSIRASTSAASSARSWFGFMLDHGHRARDASRRRRAATWSRSAPSSSVRRASSRRTRARDARTPERWISASPASGRSSAPPARGWGAAAPKRWPTPACDVTILARTEADAATHGRGNRRADRPARCAGSRATSPRPRAARRRSPRARARHPGQQRRRTAARRLPRLGPRRMDPRARRQHADADRAHQGDRRRHDRAARSAASSTSRRRR